MAALDADFVPSPPPVDLCPMCKGEGTHTLKPPHGIYIYVSYASIEWGLNGEYQGRGPHGEECQRVLMRVNELAALGYEILSSQREPLYGGPNGPESPHYTSFIMQWRWR